MAEKKGEIRVVGISKVVLFSQTLIENVLIGSYCESEFNVVCIQVSQYNCVERFNFIKKQNIKYLSNIINL